MKAVDAKYSSVCLLRMKPMKNKAKNKSVRGDSTSSIKNFFKNAPSGSTVCIEKESSTSDSKSVYVQALKDRLKSNNDETGKGDVVEKRKTIKNECAVELGTVNWNNRKGDDVGTNDRNAHEGGIVESGTDDYDRDEGAACLDVKSNKLCGDESCELVRLKYKDLKQTHFKLCQRHCDLSMKYDDLVKTIDALKLSQSHSAAVSDELSSTNDIFTSNQLRVLESISLAKAKDSTFIHQCVEYSYQGNESSLINKTLKGTLDKTEFRDDGTVVVVPGKKTMTPEKVARIETLFVNRVTKSKCLSGEFAERIKPTNINRLIAGAIRNVSNKGNPKKKSSQENENLNL